MVAATGNNNGNVAVTGNDNGNAAVTVAATTAATRQPNLQMETTVEAVGETVNQ